MSIDENVIIILLQNKVPTRRVHDVQDQFYKLV